MEGALALLATLLSAAFLVPQLRQLRRTHDSGGVSCTAATVGLVSTLAWAVYGIGTTAHALVPPSLVGSIQYGSLLWLLRRSGRASVIGAVVGLGWGLVLAAAGVTTAAAGEGPWVGVGTTLTVAVAVQYIPAVIDAHRSETVTGISFTTWVLVAASGLTWAAYGLVVGDLAVAAYGAVLVMAAAAVLAVGRGAVGVAMAQGSAEG